MEVGYYINFQRTQKCFHENVGKENETYMDILGQYGFDNFTLLSALMDEKEIINTSVHEYAHFGLSNQSTYGMALYCLNKLIIPFDAKEDINKKKAANKFFMDCTLKVQEGVAVFIESIYFMLRDKVEYKQFIEELQRTNSTYYGYIRPLLFMLNLLEKEGDRNDMLCVTNAVFQVALMSMNAEIYKLDGIKFSTNKLIKKMISQKFFSKEYMPNKRFFNSIEACKNSKTCDELCEQLLACTEISDYSNSIEEAEDKLKCVKEFIVSIFSGSKYYELYNNKLADINIKESDTENLFLQQVPTTFNEEFIKKNMKRINSEIFKIKCKTIDYSMLFLLGNFQNITLELIKKMGVKDLPVIKEDKEIALFYELINKEICGCTLESNQINEILLDEDRKSVLLTSYKNFDYEKMCLLNHPDIESFIYIYCDRTYSNAKSYFDLWAKKNVYYKYMQYESMLVLLVKIDEKTIFMLPMTAIVAEEADEDIRKNRNNMMITDFDDEEYDSNVITDATRRDEIDTIINCLFFLNLEPKI